MNDLTSSPKTAKLYTPNMILVSSLLGGPLPAGYLISTNYNALNNQKMAKTTLFWAIASVFILYFVGIALDLIFHSKSNLLAGATGALAFLLRRYTKQMQWRPKSLRASWWMTIFISLIGLLINLFVVFGLSFLIFILIPVIFKIALVLLQGR